MSVIQKFLIAESGVFDNFLRNGADNGIVRDEICLDAVGVQDLKLLNWLCVVWRWLGSCSCWLIQIGRCHKILNINRE